MKRHWKALAGLLLFLMAFVTGCSQETAQSALHTAGKLYEQYQSMDTGSAEDTDPDSVQAEPQQQEQQTDTAPAEDGSYTSKDDVAAYLNAYGHLPDNFITKKQAQELGWDSSKGNLSEVAPGKSIGGDRFGNYEGILPKASGRTYYECDINSTGSYRGAERIVFSNDGLIYYTADHYQTFDLLYGDAA